MNIRLMVKLYEQQGMTLLEAQSKVINDAADYIEHQDRLLAQCIENLPQHKVEEIFKIPRMDF